MEKPWFCSEHLQTDCYCILDIMQHRELKWEKKATNWYNYLTKFIENKPSLPPPPKLSGIALRFSQINHIFLCLWQYFQVF
jgi:hypothetical protein